MSKLGRKPLFGRPMTAVERQRRRRNKLARDPDYLRLLAERIWKRLESLELSQAKHIHAELGKLIRQAAKDER
jgi:hypothetical protein